MRVFEVYLNGERLCAAGIDSDGSLNVMVDHVKGKGRDRMHLRVGGFVNATQEFLNWKRAELRIGDELRIKITDSDVVDEPERREIISSWPTSP